MANIRNDWQGLLKLANEELKQGGVQIDVSATDDGGYDVIINNNGITETYASGYYEHELGELVDDAWVHARSYLKNTRADNSEQRQIWMRLGAFVRGTAEEIEKVINGDGQMLQSLIKKGEYDITGDSYIPYSQIEEYNEEYGTDHDICDDVYFDL